MKQNRLKYEEPILTVFTFNEKEIYTLTTSTEYDPDKIENGGNIPSIEDIINGQ